MAATSVRHFNQLIALARSHLEQVKILELDSTPERSILRIEARRKNYRLLITEIISAQARRYSYYALDGNIVIAGFDNAADPRALRLKYGQINREHAGEFIPHVHLANKTQIELTAEMALDKFVQWIQEHLE